MTEVLTIAVATPAIIAVVEFVKRLRAKDLDGAITIAVAAFAGAAVGYLGVAGLTVEAGLIAGLDAVGLHTVVTTEKKAR